MSLRVFLLAAGAAAMLSLALIFLSGCAQIPVRRTYSVSGSYGDAKAAVSLTLEPAERRARP